MLRLAFADEFPRTKGDNCLLTSGSAFIDLPFSPLLALRSTVAARSLAAAVLGDVWVGLRGEVCPCFSHGL
jgi:hypothetical protein